MSQLEIVRKDGTVLGKIDETRNEVTITEEWRKQKRKQTGLNEDPESEEEMNGHE